MAGKSRDWLKEAIRRIETDFTRSADTHLFRFDIPAVPKVRLYLKDEFGASDRQPQASAGALAVPLQPL